MRRLTAMAQPSVPAVLLGQERIENAGREICWYFRSTKTWCCPRQCRWREGGFKLVAGYARLPSGGRACPYLLLLYLNNTLILV